ncbi:TatD family hydrolase [Schumannella luteola]|uniref:TatD DNase family protein n=1 Tax=Schumannella luteola TaxID=472059 RepID=A0A852YJJ2_9MICO|nr:TatD family hydrolase [Schumannella luteola]NYG99308.1 TatD DNase family protein [Schumannella luteola]TPX06042.1 TatD family deoxyribonuclease [Schumannella luteola]
MSDYPPLPEALVVPVYDNHTHLEPSFDPERVGDDGGLGYLEQLDRASSVGVRGVVQVGTDLASSRWSAEVAAREPRVLAAVALHPNDAAELAEAGQLDEHLDGIAELAGQPRVRAIGETGLDFFRTPSSVGQEAQRRSFEAHIALAKQHDLALQIHDRDAHAEVVETLDRVGAPERTVFHCFSGDAEFAKLVADRGWYLSFAGTVTFKNAQNLRDALAVIPRSRILIETDAPYLTPTPFRGRPNSSYLIPHTLRFMAAELGTDASMLAAQISSNTELVYGHWDDMPVVTPPGPFDAHPEGTAGP